METNFMHRPIRAVNSFLYCQCTKFGFYCPIYKFYICLNNCTVCGIFRCLWGLNNIYVFIEGYVLVDILRVYLDFRVLLCIFAVNELLIVTCSFRVYLSLFCCRPNHYLLNLVDLIRVNDIYSLQYIISIQVKPIGNYLLKEFSLRGNLEYNCINVLVLSVTILIINLLGKYVFIWYLHILNESQTCYVVSSSVYFKSSLLLYNCSHYGSLLWFVLLFSHCYLWNRPNLRAHCSVGVHLVYSFIGLVTLLCITSSLFFVFQLLYCVIVISFGYYIYYLFTVA